MSNNTIPAEVQKRINLLEQWKREASSLLDPILEYGRKHPDIKLGASITDFVLERCKQYDELKAEHDELQKRRTELLKLYKNYKDQYENELVDHAALKAKAQRLVDALESIYNGAPPLTDEQAWIWIDVASNFAHKTLQEWNTKEPKEGDV